MAHKLLLKFVVDCKLLYGFTFLSFNFHNLIHLAEDSELYGNLQNFSAFSFESYLGYVKKLVRTPHKPLAQVARRVSEIERNKIESNTCESNELRLSKEHKDGPKLSGCRGKQFKNLQFGNTKLNNTDELPYYVKNWNKRKNISFY